MTERPTQQRRVDASMSLLNDLFTSPLDPGYREAAERREASGDGSASADPRLRFSASMMSGMVALGLLLTLGALQVRDSAPVVTSEREELIERVRAENERVSELNAEISAIEAEISDMESSSLQNTAVGQALRTDLRRVEAITGSGRVVGPGAVVTLSNSDTQSAEEGGSVLSIDLEVVVNGLWAAGAEAIAINDQRVTPMTSIQGVESIPQVNQQPLMPPYEVRAIGDGNTLATRLSEGDAGAWLRQMATVGPTFDISTADELELPAANPSLVLAEPQEVS